MTFILNSIKSDRLNDLAISASQLFTGYSKERFYTKPTNETNAHGAFQSYYETLREKAILIKELVVAQKKRKRAESGNYIS